jgi:SAM-dependent methyltransferase
MIPHENSAKFYDFVYKKRFGANYDRLTNANLNKISSYVKSGKVLDFGAGTGRISIPLAQQGFDVTAIDKSQAMLDIIKEKAVQYNLNIQSETNIKPYTDATYDIAISIFTVLAYITEQDEIDFTIKQLWDTLKQGGYFIFDLASKIGYEERCKNYDCITNTTISHDFTELVKVTLYNEDDITFGKYYEKVEGIYNATNFEYTEEFNIRFWKIEELNSILSIFNFVEKFDLMGATYYVYQRGPK